MTEWSRVAEFGPVLVALILIGAWAFGLVVREGVAIAARMPRPDGTLPVLAALGAAAPLVGLLGTVAALVRVFESDAASSTIASSIAGALLTTQVGLFIAVPTIVAREVLLRLRERRAVEA